ncbi:MAG: hypothetical protein Q4C49_03320 [Bacillota bacterium]|nr:hypothetical protein [Bacillota bacterium]
MRNYQSIRHYFKINKESKDLITDVKLMISNLKLNKEIPVGLFSIEEIGDFVHIQTYFQGKTKENLYNRSLFEKINQTNNGSYAIVLSDSCQGVDYGIYGDNVWEKAQFKGSFISHDNLHISLKADFPTWKEIFGDTFTFTKEEDIVAWKEKLLSMLYQDCPKLEVEIENVFFYKEDLEILLKNKKEFVLEKETLLHLSTFVEKLENWNLAISVHLKHGLHNEDVYANSFVSEYYWDVLSFRSIGAKIGEPFILTPRHYPKLRSLKISLLSKELEKVFSTSSFDQEVLKNLSDEEVIACFHKMCAK